jgi:peptidoglycan/xylan/chitin deacetylase (PgdA/CDA1 family)
LGVFFETYAEVKAEMPSGLRGWLRDLALRGLTLTHSRAATEAALSKPRVQFLYIHHVFRDEESALRRLLDFLMRQHTFISYSEAVDRIWNDRITNPFIAVSSDDGFRNNLAAGKILNEYGISGCFFINPGITELKQYDDIARHCRDTLFFPPVEFLNWDEVTELKKLGHEIGAHTMKHMDIGATPASQVADDLAACHEIISRRCGEARHFAFPYGRFSNFNREGREACFRSGFISCATAERGCHVGAGRKLNPEELCIRRDHVVLDWKPGHTTYFLVQNARRASPENNFFPY